ncbi:MAG: arginine--tRNA ligase [Candidatus Daviesbacteria bacterium]|nr:arginine--tRNA ligase [Candidatus Daviesbacteria bacterium]
MIKKILEEDLKKAVESLGYKLSTDVEVYIPKNTDFGDYTTNLPLQLTKQELANGKQNPLQIANEIIEKLKHLDYLEKAEIAGGGFINFYLNTDALMKNLHLVCNYTYMIDPKLIAEDQTTSRILLEYAQPNTHKAFHIGHTRNITLGESVARLLESQGNKIYRCTYGSDIGLPVAKAIWGILSLEKEYREAKKKNLPEKASFLGKAYAKGATKYEEDETVKAEINALNIKLYLKDAKLMPIWEETRQWSLDYLEAIFTKVGTKFDGNFSESQVEADGKAMVLQNIGKVFEEDEGAVIFPGEKYGLHNRVFITVAGNPTYEAKEIGLAKLEYDNFNYDRAIHVVDVQQEGYFQVVIKAIDMLFPDLTGKKYHLSYGFVDLKGKKMSSRTGDVVTFDYLFSEVQKRVAKIMEKTDLEEKEQVLNMVSIGAIKFTMLRYSPKTKILFDLDTSVALEGDSGPYVQYAYARAKSVLRSASYDYQPVIAPGKLEEAERQLLHKIEVFPEVVAKATRDLNPTDITNFLLEVAKVFNLFYQKHQIIKAGEKAEFRLALTCSIAVILKQGLYLLGIEAPERM